MRPTSKAGVGWLPPALAAILALQVLPAKAQTTDPSTQTNPEKLQSQVLNGDITRPGAGAASAVQLSASSAANLASINLGNKLSPEWNWSILVSAPIGIGGTSSGGTSATNTNIATLDGLANGFAAKFKVSFFHTFGEKDGGKFSTDLEAKVKKACEADKSPTKPDCEHGGYGAMIPKYDTTAKTDMPEYLRDHFAPMGPILALTGGAQAGVGYNQFTFYNPRTLAKSTENSEPWSGGVYVGVMPDIITVPALITFAANYQNVFTAQSSSTMCNTINTAISCQTGSFGAPKNSEKYLLSIDLNSQVNIYGHSVGLGPQVTYDAKGHTLGVDFPIYFIADSQGSLIGGIDAGWTSENHAFSIGFIVGAPFNLFK